MIDEPLKDTADLGPDPLAEPPKPKPQRGKRGWFLPGNTASKGHSSPHASKVVALKSVLFSEIGPEQWRRIIRSMYVEAVGIFDRTEGKWTARPNVRAAEWLSDRLIGKPVESSAEDRLKRIEDSLGLDDSLDAARIAEILDTAHEQGDNGPTEDAA
ncbi:MAG: hypothetical protein ACT4PL_08625 [Phycisphaerales bacterium]